MKPFLSSDDLDMSPVFRTGRPVRFATGAKIADIDDLMKHSLLITSGVIRISILTDSGRERLLFYGPAGSLIGDHITFGDHSDVPQGIQVHAISVVEALKMSHHDLRMACAAQPEVLMRLLSWAYGKIGTLIDQLEAATFRDTAAQVAALLEAFHMESRRVGPGGCNGLLDLTHQAIASATGRTRVSVTQALNRMQLAGIIALRRGHIDVLDEGRLAQIATEGIGSQKLL
ncbi:Crp/Fnr family transcriptional regulator [Mycolicibacterium smegmatis]|uniref:Transcriptional regulator, Crp/Fnr family protein n=1 Tax=Mycolicibacterium smegmatis (strain MKD8) TaxID=1214915 RepID=A0A2U9PKD5_MYCSE|nr:Crp/Fnr family transcriptional regulator [Mycolicibacterium smegmatis]AWT52187.1 transcriptional regulator, Crp/Fnr family protein [Mycolicibacterium smegmatis MKD8]